MIDEEWNNNAFPLAYLITFRTYATWLHGDERGSVDTHGRNIYGTLDIAPNPNLEAKMRRNLAYDVILLNKHQREAIDKVIKEICEQRGYFLQAVNFRSNHVHTVVSAQVKPERLADTFKAFATKKLRENFDRKRCQSLVART